MQRHDGHRWGTHLVACVLVLLVTCASTALVPCRAIASDEHATFVAKVRVFQEYRVDVSGLQNSFTYTIEPSEADSPMPVNAAGVQFDHFELTRDQEDWLEFPIEATVSPSAEEIVYHYVLRPQTTEFDDGLYYVDVLSTDLKAGPNVYYLEIHVQLSSTDVSSTLVAPTVHIEGWDGPKATDPGWRVAYATPQQNDGKDSDVTTEQTTNDATEKKSSTAQKSSGSSSGTSSSQKLSSSNNSTSTNSSPLALTGDELVMTAALACAICGVLAVLLARRTQNRRVGEHRV